MALLVGAVVAGARAAGASVTARDVTISARPSIAGPDAPITLSGTVRTRRPGESVEIQTKDCGSSFYRAFTVTRTQSSGIWATEFFPSIGTTVRAVWNGHVSRAIAVGQRAMIRLAPKASDRTRFVVAVVARAQFWRRKIVIERLDRGRGVWRRYRSVVLTDQHAPGEFAWTEGEFTARLPRGSLLRAFLPQAQAGPCYLASYSLSVRIG